MMQRETRKIMNPPPITCEVQTMDGRMKTLTAQTMTRDIQKAWGAIASGTHPINKLPMQDQSYATAAFIYGGKTEDYFDLDIRVVNAAVKHFTNELQNPSV
jgi:hypothetical protein